MKDIVLVDTSRGHILSCSTWYGENQCDRSDIETKSDAERYGHTAVCEQFCWYSALIATTTMIKLCGPGHPQFLLMSAPCLPYFLRQPTYQVEPTAFTLTKELTTQS